jgi:hypothetical protein
MNPPNNATVNSSGVINSFTSGTPQLGGVNNSMGNSNSSVSNVVGVSSGGSDFIPEGGFAPGNKLSYTLLPLLASQQ